tara:strand:+ start:8096 stop:8830 length:735 start_codon:yes stop_codon:yes gene_type:complete
MVSLRDKIVLVTGGSRGLGRDIALAFDGEGSKVVINYRSSHEAARDVFSELSYGLGIVKCDVSKDEKVRAMMQHVKEAYSPIDVVVNNAGWTQAVAHDDLESLSPDFTYRVMGTNFHGTYHCIREAVLSGGMEKGAIVNISSIAAQRPLGSNLFYCASKAAVESLTETMAKALGPKIRVNAVAPGLLMTDLTAEWDDYHQSAAATNPLRREPTLEEVAQVVIDLVKNEAMTGQIINVDAGQSLV